MEPYECSMEEGGGVTKVLRPASVVAHARAAKIKQFFKVNHLSIARLLINDESESCLARATYRESDYTGLALTCRR